MDVERIITGRDFIYPTPDDPDFLKKIYEKKEFYTYKEQKRNIFTDYNDIKMYRDRICGRSGSGEFRLQGYQSFLSNYITPDTPYMGLLVFAGVGTGKTCAAIQIAEKFKNQVRKYGTKIYILVPGPLLIESWKSQIIGECTGETYIKDNIRERGIINKDEENKIKKAALAEMNQYYRIKTFKFFHKKVLGEKIVDKTFSETSTVKKKVYKKTEEGEFEREIIIDKIENLDNSLLIIDEAHKVTNNDYGNAINIIKKKSKNLRIVALSATPTKNNISDLVDLLNIVRPIDDKIKKDKIFRKNDSGELDIIPGGIEYLKLKARGYVSYFKGENPLTYAEGVEMGSIPKSLEFTPVMKCYMDSFQRDTYFNAMKENMKDTLLKKMNSISNCVIPGFDRHSDQIIGYYGVDGINTIINQLKKHGRHLLKEINKQLFDGKIKNEQSILTFNGVRLGGLIFKQPYLKTISAKYDGALNTLYRYNNKDLGSKTIFIYFDTVVTGVLLFEEVLLRNGYLEFNEFGNYNINDDTRCYYCNNTHKMHKEDGEHKFHPATFLSVIGEENADEMLEGQLDKKFEIINRFFNDIYNKNGIKLKFIIGSKVMNEGITLENGGAGLIMEANFNLNQIYQAFGRVIRFCKHYKSISDVNRFPKVHLYRFIIGLKDQITKDEYIYHKAELKYKMIKKLERAIKEVAIDCPINYHANNIPEEIQKYKNCQHNGNCPASCDFISCNFQCDDKILNDAYYDKENDTYKNLHKQEIDNTTFTSDMALSEINFIKSKIKILYKFKYIYKLDEIVNYIKKFYTANDIDIFDEIYVYKALDQLIPIDENDFNNFKDTIYDKYNVPGYLIYRNIYYIFQPFNLNENVPMFYRYMYDKSFVNDITIYNYIKAYNEQQEQISNVMDNIVEYNFENIKEYYDKKEDNEFIGVVDKQIIDINKIVDVFKIKYTDKSRKTKLEIINKGTVCETKYKEDLIKVVESLLTFNYYGIDDIIPIDLKLKNKHMLCNKIFDRMHFMEKYSTTEDKNKKTYLIIPKNYPEIEFPINLEDKLEELISNVRNEIKLKFDINVTNIKNGKFKNIEYPELPKYKIAIKDMKEYSHILSVLGFQYDGEEWIALIE